jgi:ribosome biogenesis GTPase
VQLQGQVYQTLGKFHVVWDGAKLRPAFPGGRLELESRQKKNRVAVGDRVVLRVEGDGSALIEEVLPRRNRVSRRITFTGAEHVVAANVDVLAVMLAPSPALRMALLDRYLVAARACGVEPLIVVNKMDLLDPAEVQEALAPYLALGYAACRISAGRREGLEEFLGLVRGRWVLLVGHSGVGKTTLVNDLVPGEAMAVAEVRDGTGKGRHTTTTAVARRAPDGTTLVDTAGIREFALWDVGWREVEAGFPEIHEAGARCRFPDCRHRREPGCAVTSALEAGALTAARYGSYLTLLGEAEAAEAASRTGARSR